jgi:hypothetical protein
MIVNSGITGKPFNNGSLLVNIENETSALRFGSMNDVLSTDGTNVIWTSETQLPSAEVFDSFTDFLDVLPKTIETISANQPLTISNGKVILGKLDLDQFSDVSDSMIPKQGSGLQYDGVRWTTKQLVATELFDLDDVEGSAVRVHDTLVHDGVSWTNETLLDGGSF